MATIKTRGSAAMASGKNAVQASALQKAIKGFKLIDWHQLGTPHPELISGGISGPPGKIGAAVAALMKIKEIRGIEILINGTPKPDLAVLRFQMRGK